IRAPKCFIVVLEVGVIGNCRSFVLEVVVAILEVVVDTVFL
ncbi:26759_t:CDS:1, partial [Dentiscutata erythropus]